MKKTAIAMLAVACLGLSGCYTTASPEGVLRSAYKALMKNDVKKFPKFLTGEAKAQYSTLIGMGELQERLAAYAKVDVGSIELIHTVANDAGKDVSREYAAQVMGAEAEGSAFASVMTATVLCEVYYTYENASPGYPPSYPYPPASYGPAYDPAYGPVYYGPYPYSPYPHHPYTHVWEREHEDCRISKLD